MKKYMYMLTASIISLLLLTSCDAHIGKNHYDVKWWVIAVPVIIIITVIHIWIISKKYECPNCKTVFRPKWYEISSWIHLDNKRVVKCPKCKRKGFCRRYDLPYWE